MSLRTNLFVVALALALFGNVMVYSATSIDYGTHYLIVRSAHVALGVVTFLVVKQVRYTSWRKIAPGFYIVVLVSLALVLIPSFGTEVGGARRWFDLGPVSLQPAEFAKLAAILLLSCAVARKRPGSRLPLRPIASVGLLVGLVFLEPDFGTSVVIVAGAAGVLWASELRTGDLLLAGAAVFVALVGMMFLEPYRRDRFLTFLDPWSVSDGSGYQIVQSMVVIKAGSFFGAGTGAGAGGVVVPEVQTDMIFALIGEELGLLGMMAVIGAFGFLAIAGFKIALDAPSVLARCLAAGLATMLAVQTTFNIGAAMGAVPLAGMTLPFVSYGGSSMIVCFVTVGILYRISEDGERAREVESRKKSTSREAGGPASLDRRRRNGGARDPRALRGG
ncbi:MAG: Stage V sporulation protein E / Cell division protein FtsW [uncultured Rubrobacteraceae bacterium]|uniref:Probable peptidoglycan glycosyltransferase FtsW n=1 Tax=uncultured Rubrobacteraceae bacterium TaxID=349277 RepID=A0A6J4QYN9_9ACTN|nr:MAG: Stage V sporulation protein E / Cell division protein FtsW [uncultured Rubrobacteraceae bacterium]